MWKDKLYKIITEYWSKIKTIWIILVLFFMIIAIKTYMNYSLIIQEITKVNSDIENINLEITYSKNFYEKYLDSDYAPYFLAHKNNTLFYNESIIRLIAPDTENSWAIISGNDIQIPTNENSSITPRDARKEFIKSKLN